MTIEGLKELFCEWCPKDCEDRKEDPLTDEERAGCVASSGFAQAAHEAAIDEAFPGPSEIQWYRHHNRLVAVQAGQRGGHRNACLCFRCGRFNPDTPDDNCPIANANFALCVLTGIVTPVWECPDYA